MMLKFLVLFLLLLSVGEAFSANNQVNAFRVWDSSDRTLIVFDLKKAPNYKKFSLDKPDRIVIDLKQGSLKGKLPKFKRSHAFVKKLRTAAQKNNVYRFVVDTKAGIGHKVYPLPPNKRYGHRLIVELFDKNAAASAQRKSSKPALPRRQPKLRDVIVAIDAGHGGKDPGALGSLGTKEKMITLKIAKKLKRVIDRQKGMRAVLIRKDDYFVSLRKRIVLARDAKADMFISIHADAFNNPKVKGSSVYVLSERGASDEASKWLADQENSVDLLGGVTLDDKDEVVARVLLDLSQTATIEASATVAGNILSEIRRVGPVHKNSVQHARFVVLKSPDIPSLLVETAFISNPREERRLRDGRYQDKLANAILKGVKKYFRTNPLPNTYLARKNRSFLTQPGNKLAQLN